MANSKLLKEAIADAKAVRATAIANAKIALEEAFTPRLQSLLSKKLQAEMADEDEDDEQDVLQAEPVEDEVTEDEDEIPTDEEIPAEEEIPVDEDEEVPVEEPEEDEDELDLEAIIRELEGETDEEPIEDDEPCEGCDEEPPIEEDDDEELGIDIEDDETPAEEAPVEDDDEIDLDEILREMGYGDDEPAEEDVPAEDDKTDELEAELGEAYKTIKSLKRTINEVNLLNAKLLYSNKLFRSYNLTNEQKVKVVENLDRTSNVREVKLVYATLAESMKFTGTEKKVKRNISEGFASKTTASTAPKKDIITESTDAMADRWKQLAGITKK